MRLDGYGFYSPELNNYARCLNSAGGPQLDFFLTLQISVLFLCIDIKSNDQYFLPQLWISQFAYSLQQISKTFALKCSPFRLCELFYATLHSP